METRDLIQFFNKLALLYFAISKPLLNIFKNITAMILSNELQFYLIKLYLIM
jgi:hypothetical protein